MSEMMGEGPDLSVVVPVYKEERNVRPFLDRVERVMVGMGVQYEVIFCLDPSPDRTEEVIQKEIERNASIKLVVFSRRFGQPSASMAGIFLCRGKVCVVIDVDLQDPPELIPVMYSKLQGGYEVVYAERRLRKGEAFVKRMVSWLGYSLINQLSEVKIPRNTGDFRVMTRRVIEELRRLNESHGFLRGLVAYVGFRQAGVEYDRDKRYQGKGNYNRYLGSLTIGMNGIVSFSSRPLQIMAVVGGLVAGCSFLIGLWYVFQKLTGMSITTGLPTMVLLVSFFAGTQLLCLGLLGEYIGRIYDEVKRRPKFIVDRKVNFD